MFVLVTFVTTLVAQEKLRGNKIIITKDRGISSFDAIEVKGKIEVILTQCNNQSVTVETDENLQFAVITEVRDDTLIINLSKRIVRKKVLNIYVTIDEYINKITTKDKAKITADGLFHFSFLTIDAEGDSKITMDIKSEQFILNNKESANVNFSVNAENITINANKTGKSKINLSANTVEILTQGNSTTELKGDYIDIFITSENKSNVKASELECDDAIVNASDVSDVRINSNTSIIISATNSAEVYIYDNPKITLEKFIDKAILRKK